MTITLHLRMALVAVVAAILGAGSALAQEKKLPDEKKFEAVDSMRPANLVLAGYATPGTAMSTKLEAMSGKVLGGTVYFAVFRRTGRTGDTWGLGANFDSHFVEGENIRRGVSPHLDTEAEYLYLYQVVNDRAVHDPKLNKPSKTGAVAVALDKGNLNRKVTEDIASFSLRLVVDPRQITSWGYFTESGFSLKTFDKSAKDADGLRLVASSSPLIGGTLPEKEYRPGAVSKRIDNDRKLGFRVDSDKVGLNESLPFTKERINGVRAVALKDSAANGGRKPDLVQIIYADTPITPIDYERSTSGDPVRGIFRVDWKNVPAVAEGEHSVIVGFTSDAPPIDQPIRLKDAEEAVVADRDLESEFRLVSDSGAAAAASSIAAAVGVNIPSPQSSGFEAAVAPPGGGVLTPVLGGGVTGYGGGSGMPQTVGAGGLGAARPSNSGGGMQGGGGQGSGTDQSQSQVPTITNSNTNINPQSNVQQQGQFQGQLQAQLQAQLQKMLQNGHHGHGHGGGHGCCNGNVVPEPGAMLLGLVGLPGLWFFYRRKTAVMA